MKEIILSKPITAHGEEVRVLELREPTYDEIESLGIPFSYTASGEMNLNTASALKYIPVLAGIPRSSAKQMTPGDVFSVGMAVIGFFTGSGNQED
ncbi:MULTISPECIES: phage tail assembly protein [Enterobacteriaceae]|uniref:phage tail assembly protein n=1 Tax=Enterobacteriaceae TaxID=543 RepID=UPI0015EAB21E|nr:MULTISPECIES: phage tail assembly protein [Enterobacteriaceae]BBV67553.1 hypothetical protein STW0522KLE44_39410 [Klebsiella sp. STW0522-44]HDG1688928.1 phage tail assembly protein [Kluyvera georgiana]MCS0536140.1 phage tail assembly protein [Citrobacter portucalensis]MDV0786177.1 phage tail assembly protein [Citrobacter amalonaticus]MEB0642240.1 phage tail assembly protein [Citrobacter amalonaticus]